MGTCECGCIYVDVQEPYRAEISEMLPSTGVEMCGECSRLIPSGEEYELYIGGESEEKLTDRYITCKDCLSVRKVFFCDWIFGHIWEDLVDYIEDVDGEITTDCIAALTPLAREGVIEVIDERFREIDEEEDEG